MRSVRCRLGIHRWERRESCNGKDHESWVQCSRCPKHRLGTFTSRSCTTECPQHRSEEFWRRAIGDFVSFLFPVPCDLQKDHSGDSIEFNPTQPAPKGDD